MSAPKHLRDEDIPRGDAARGAFTIRYRRRVQASPPRGLRQAWDEYQVVWRRCVVARFDLHDQADRWVRDRISSAPSS